MKILLIEDNTSIANSIISSFADHNHEVIHADNASDGLEIATHEKPSAIILDRMLPGKVDGLTIIEKLRAQGNVVPVLILSALVEVDERIKGLRAGGDDYLTKPFAIGELLARVEILGSRRSMTPPLSELRVGEVVINYRTHAVERAGRLLKLRPREFMLLEYLMKHAEQVVTRAMLLENVWKYEFDPETNVIEVQINKLRSKLDEPFEKPMIQTVRNVGYILRANA